MHKFSFLFTALLAIACCFAFTIPPAPAKLKWMTIREAREAMKQEKRPILIDLYTDWCGWCKVMDKKTYTNAKVIEYVQQHFYPVKINAETKEDITWNDKTYKFNPADRANDFAIYLTHGQLSFPTTVIIPVQGGEPQPVPGYLPPKDLQLIVTYFGEGKFGTQPFDAYQQSFKSSW